MAGIYKISEILQENYKLKEEVILLRKVVDAAKEWINCPCEDIRECLECTAFKFRSALAELDKEGE
jgi:predicted aldo/keto reductase-like oxidoreductase